MRGGTEREGRADQRLSPAASPRVRVLSVCAATALHGAMAATALLYAPPPAVVSTPSFDVVLIVEKTQPPAPTLSSAAEPVETAETTVHPVPEPQAAEPPSIVAQAPDPEPVAEHPVEPSPAEAIAPPAPVAAAPLPPAPRPRPSRPVAAAPSAPVPQPSEPQPARPQLEAPAVAVAPAPRAAVSHVEADYIAALLGWLERYKDYPRTARLRRIEGTAMVRLAILADGTLGALSLARSSGHAILDDAAIDMVRRAAPLPRPPHAPCELEVPIVFAQGRP